MSTVKTIDRYTIFDIKGLTTEEYVEECIIPRIYKEDLLQYEIESLGLYITDHPMDNYIVNDNVAAEIKDIDEYSDNSFFNTVGAISGIGIRKTKAKMNMCSFHLTTANESVECIMFPKAYAAYLATNKNTIKEGALVFIKGRVKEESNGRSIIVNDVSGDVRKCLCEIGSKMNKIMYKRISDLTTTDFCETLLHIEVIPKLRFTLEKL